MYDIDDHEKECWMCEYYDAEKTSNFGTCTEGLEEFLIDLVGCGTKTFIRVAMDNKACKNFEWNDKAKCEYEDMIRDQAEFEREHGSGMM